MRKNSMTKCAVGAMLFGGTLGMSQAASADLAFTLNGPQYGGAPTTNFVYTALAYVNYDWISESASFNNSFAQTSLSTPSSGLSASFTATNNSTGFATSVSTAATSGINSNVHTYRSFTVTGTQQITMIWGGSSQISLREYMGGNVSVNSSWSAPITPGAGWFNLAFASFNEETSGSVTITLDAGDYAVRSVLYGQAAGASFSFVVPAPGALALLGVSGIVGARRRRA